jgi:hypothetical protein
MEAARGLHIPHLTTRDEATDKGRSAHSTIQALKGISDIIMAKTLVVALAVPIEEAWGNLHQILAELISAPPAGLLILGRCNDTKRRDYASKATRRAALSSSSRGLRARGRRYAEYV